MLQSTVTATRANAIDSFWSFQPASTGVHLKQKD